MAFYFIPPLCVAFSVFLLFIFIGTMREPPPFFGLYDHQVAKDDFSNCSFSL